MGIIGILAAGLIVGVLAKRLVPGDKDTMRLALTLVGGIVNLLAGLMIFRALGGHGGLGAQWARWTVPVLGAALLVVVAATIPRRSTPRGSHGGR